MQLYSDEQIRLGNGSATFSDRDRFRKQYSNLNPEQKLTWIKRAIEADVNSYRIVRIESFTNSDDIRIFFF